MKAITRFLFGSAPPRQYETLKISADEIQEHVDICGQGGPYDITHSHYILCQSPFVVAIFTKNPIADKPTVRIRSNTNKTIAKAALLQVGAIALKAGLLQLYHVESVSVPVLSWFRFTGLIGYFFLKRKNRITFNQLKLFSVFFLYPRKVVLICVGQGSRFNCFPMDLQGNIGSDHVVLGLRNTNVSMNTIKEDGVFVVAEVSADFVDTIYDLGRHHSNKPPSLDKLPFRLKLSRRYQIPIPEFAFSYVECSFTSSMNLGSHSLIIGEVQQTRLTNSLAVLYHRHIIARLAKLHDYQTLEQRF